MTIDDVFEGYSNNFLVIDNQLERIDVIRVTRWEKNQIWTVIP